MNVYRVTFLRNEIATVKLAETTFVLKGNEDYHYEHHGVLVYAHVQATSDHEAREKAAQIIQKIRSREE